MMYGHVDNPRHWVNHLRVLSRIQDETNDVRPCRFFRDFTGRLCGAVFFAVVGLGGGRRRCQSARRSGRQTVRLGCRGRRQGCSRNRALRPAQKLSARPAGAVIASPLAKTFVAIASPWRELPLAPPSNSSASFGGAPVSGTTGPDRGRSVGLAEDAGSIWLEGNATVARLPKYRCNSC